MTTWEKRLCRDGRWFGWFWETGRKDSGTGYSGYAFTRWGALRAMRECREREERARASLTVWTE